MLPELDLSIFPNSWKIRKVGFFWIEANVVLPNCCTSLKGRETEVLQAPLILYLVNLRILLQARYVRRREGDSVYD